MSLPSIKIPHLLSLSCANNSRLRKAITIYLFLKTIDIEGAGKINYNSFIDEATRHLGVHYKTINAWLKLAVEFGLLSRNYFYNDYNGLYKMISWDDLSRKFDCSYNRFYHIKIKNLQFKFEYILERYAIEEKQKQCKRACQIKYEYSLVKDELNNVVSELGIKNSLTDLKNCQQFDFLTAKTRLTENQRFFINAANPDINIGYKKLSAIFGYKSIGGLAYKKRKLQELGLIQVQHRMFPVQDEFRPLLTTNNARETQLGQVNYFRPLKKLVLIQCDHITTNPQTQWRSAPPDHAEKI